MNRIFLQMLNISFQASWLILAVLILRLVLKKVPRWIPCLMWGMVALRLAVPFRIESALSRIPSAEPVPVQIDRISQPAVHSGIPVMDRAVNQVVTAQFTPDPAASVNPLQIVVYLAAVLWIAGMICIILYYAWASDPHVTVWEEILQFTEEDGKFVVSEETLNYHEQIASAEEYDAVYPTLNGSLIDYTVNGLGDALANSAQKEELSDPVRAARILLNLSDDPNEVSISMLQDGSSVGIPVSITFVKEQKERKVRMVKINDAIWVPQEYGTDMVENIDLLDRMVHIFAEQQNTPMPWNNPADWNEDADRLIQMAVDETGRYEAYGVYCGEYGTMGIIFNDTIDGTETNENTFYYPWVYTGAQQDEPKLAWADGNLLFTYPVETYEKDGETCTNWQLA